MYLYFIAGRFLQVALGAEQTSLLAQLTDDQLLREAKDTASSIVPFCPDIYERNPLTYELLHIDPAVAYRKAADARVFYRIYKTAARRYREMQALQAGQVGARSTGAKYKYASSAALSSYNSQKIKTATFVKSAVVYDSATGTSVPLEDVMITPEMQASRRLAFLKAMERLALDAGLSWAMMTITMPSEFHPNPANANKSFNGVGFDRQQKYLSDKFNKIRAMLRKVGIILSGVRVHEPQADGTPHWHILFFIKQLNSFTILHAVFSFTFLHFCVSVK